MPRFFAWRRSGLLYLAFCLAGLAAGLWPDAIYPSRADVPAAPLPVLQALAVAQVAFFLLAGPLVLWSLRAASPRRYWPRAAATLATYLLVAVPFYVAGAYLADATPADAVRTAVYIVCLLPLCGAAGVWLSGGSGARAATLVFLLVAAIGLPAGCYIAREFLAAVAPAEWLRQLAPATFAWQTAASRGGSLLPSPAWAALVWPAAGAAGILLRALIPHRTGG